MFKLNEKEVEHMVSQNVIPSKSKLGGALPYAFTEQGVAMLSSVLNSDKAIDVNITIIRTLILVKQYALDYAEPSKKIKQLEKKYNANFKEVFAALNFLVAKKKEENV